MKTTVNAEEQEVPDGLTVPGLLVHLRLSPDRVAIERNLAILPRSQWGETRLQPNDRFEIVHLVGGG